MADYTYLLFFFQFLASHMKKNLNHKMFKEKKQCSVRIVIYNFFDTKSKVLSKEKSNT